MIFETVVFVYLPDEVKAVPAGTLTLNQVRNEISSKFVYGYRYTKRTNAIELDPVTRVSASRTLKARQVLQTIEKLGNKS